MQRQTQRFEASVEEGHCGELWFVQTARDVGDAQLLKAFDVIGFGTNTDVERLGDAAEGIRSKVHREVEPQPHPLAESQRLPDP